MSQELKTVTVNLKSLDQDIKDPIDAAAADATTKANNALKAAKEYANSLVEWQTL